MSEYGGEIDAILAKGVSEWTNEEAQTIASLVAKGHRENLKKAMLEVRGGEKPQVNNSQEVVS